MGHSPTPGTFPPMSDTAQAAGWWLASDGKWYPPELHPSYVPPPSPPATVGHGDLPMPMPDDVNGQLLEITTALRIALLQFAGEVERLERAVRALRSGST